LKLHCENCEKHHSQPRLRVVYEAMRKRFGELTLDPDTQRPILMSETAIVIWLKARYTARKAAAVEDAVASGIAAADRAQGPAEGSDGDDESDERQCKTDSTPPKIRFLRFLGLKPDRGSKIDAKNAMKTRTKPTESSIYP